MEKQRAVVQIEHFENTSGQQEFKLNHQPLVAGSEDWMKLSGHLGRNGYKRIDVSLNPIMPFNLSLFPECVHLA